MTDTTKPMTLVLDFDNVIHSYVSGWQGVDVIPDPPHKGAFAFIERAMVDFDVAILSSRSGVEAGRFAMAKWFVRHGFRADTINWRECQDAAPDPASTIDPNSAEGLARRFNDLPNDMRPARLLSFPWAKPAAWLSLDDRAMQFNGKWPSMEVIANFKPWNARDKKPRKVQEPANATAAGDQPQE